MKKTLWPLAFLFLTAHLLAQTNAPVKLALIAETDEASPAVDVLTATLSGGSKVQLLERDEIEKVYREQGMSVANRNDLKLSRMLGADGLLLLDIVRTPQTTNLTARLIAVKPGVVLTDGSFPWPLKDTTQWAESATTYLNSFLPKLTVLVKDAIPISIVNLRAAVSSADEQETERELKLLTIQRLSQERQFFVLERQKMQLLSEEKELKSDESAFWNGSYLLDGTVDQNGYSKETVTINSQLIPPKGGVPLSFEVSGNRTNLSEVINHLAAKVTELLKVSSTVPEWNAANEATQYFDEAKWALRWNVFSEAQAAADSAWALGKKDLDCASVRVRSYVMEISAYVGRYQHGESSITSGHDANGVPLGPTPTDSEAQPMLKELADGHPFGMVCQVTKHPGDLSIYYIFADKPPDPRNIDRALHVLGLYYEFSQNSSVGDLLKTGSEATQWHNSDWHDLGIEGLVAASQVLQNFNFAPDSQKPVAGKLAELRALTRTVADWITQTPSVHDSYFVGDRIATHDELANAIGGNPNIFRCRLEWGCFWQETPEDCVALYRELMSSPVFCYIHNDLWTRELQTPRLTAWNEEDRKRIPAVWTDFVQELSGSTNVLLRMEAKALARADATNDDQAKAAENGWWSIVHSNRDDLVANNVELLYLGWGFSDNSEAEAMDQEYWNKTVPAGQFLSTFKNQKKYLKENKPCDFMEFAQLFSSQDYSRVQALEIQPLIVAYKSNLVAQSQTASGMQSGQLMGAIAQVGFLENDVNRILNPQQQAIIQAPKPTMAKTVASEPTATNAPEIVTNVITANKFSPIPLDSLYHLNDGEYIADSSATVTAHHWFEEKLLLNFQYNAHIELRDEKRVLVDNRTAAGDAIAIFDPATEHWSIVDCPEPDVESYILSQNHFYHRSVLLHGELFTCDEKQIKQYDVQKQHWNLLSISDGNNYELFIVNGHLYAANQNTIFEILDGGTRTHILASNRRQPPASLLDTENLGTPTLFAGPGQSLRTAAGNKIAAWSGEDWRSVCSAPEAPMPPVISDDGVLFLADGWNAPAGIWRLTTESDQVEFCLGQQVRWSGGATVPSPNKNSQPAWKLPPEFSLPRLPAASRGPDLYLMVDHAKSQDIVNEQQHLNIGKKILPQNGYHAVLLCFDSNSPAPQKIFLKFDGEDASIPVTGDNHPSGFMVPFLPSAWLLFSTNYLFCGRETSDAIPNVGGDPRIGVWMIPLGQIDPEIARQKKAQQEQQAQSNAQAKQVAQTLLEKYDRNHNGLIDPDERENALDNAAFIESQLEVIDANHNGLLDPEELAYFDANTNKILDPKEQAGIEIAQHLLAQKLLKKFDTNGDGVLDRQEFNELVQSGSEAQSQRGPNFPSKFLQARFPDDNHDGIIDLAELEGFLNQQLRSKLCPRGPMGAAYYNQMMADPGNKVDARQSFKDYVELYWQNYSTGTAGTSTAPAQKSISDEERRRVLQRLMQKRNAETPP